MSMETITSDESPKISPVDPIEYTVSTPALVGICLATTVFLVSIAAVTCLCYRRRSSYQSKWHSAAERPISLRRPTAVKYPSGNSYYLKKTPSPTGYKTPPGSGKTPPGGKSPGSKSPGSGTTASPGTKTSGKSLTPTESSKDFDRRSSEKKRCSLSPQTEVTEIVKYSIENEKEKAALPYRDEDDNRKAQSNEDLCHLGKLSFKVRYCHEKTSLMVTVVCCSDLPPRDATGGSSCDPYVKLQLLPEKHHKAKTRVLRRTLNPQYDEDFTFYGIKFNQLQGITLHFVVLSFDRYSRDDVIGEVMCSMSSVEFSETEDAPIHFSRPITPRSFKIRSQGRGELLVSLCYQPAANRLTVVVLKARNLPKMDITGFSDPYVKIYLLYNGQRVAKKKTHVKKRTLNPVFNESFVFDLPQAALALDDISLEFLLLDWDRVTKNEVIGRLELGGSRCSGSALHHWKEVISSPRRQIAEWHKLRE